MGKNTEISWCESTFSPWWGCRKISSGCDNCYAEALDHRLGRKNWVEGEYQKMKDKYWIQPLNWNKKAVLSGIRHKVFCGSMCDWADSKGPISERERLWELIRATPMLDWLLLTKRAKHIKRYLPEDWGSGYDNVWLGVSVEDQKHGLPRIDILRYTPAKVRFLSVEPLLEDLDHINLDGIDWVIVGGESGPVARPMKKEWVIGVALDCKIFNNVPFFFKQWGRKDNDEANHNVKKGGCLLNGKEFKKWPK